MEHATYQYFKPSGGAAKIIRLYASQSATSGVLLDNTRPCQDTLVVSTVGRVDWIDTQSILYCKANSNYTEVHLIDGRMKLMSKTLKWTEAKLSQSDRFCRCHQSYLVNMDFATALDKSGFWQIHLKGGAQIPVSRTGRARLKASMSE